MHSRRDALLSSMRDLEVETRQIERRQRDGIADDADMATVKLIKLWRL